MTNTNKPVEISPVVLAAIAATSCAPWEKSEQRLADLIGT